VSVHKQAYKMNPGAHVGRRSRKKASSVIRLMKNQGENIEIAEIKKF